MSHFYDKKLANNPFAGTYKFVLLLFSGTIESNLCVCFPSLSRTILIRYSFLPHSYEFPWKSSRAFFARFFFVGVIRSTSISFHECNNMLVNASRREWERERHCECVTSSIFGVQLAGNKVKMKFSWTSPRISNINFNYVLLCML